MNDIVAYHLKRAEALKTDRGNFDTQWDEAAELLIPGHKDTFSSGGQNTPGLKNTERLFDSVGPIALQRFSAVMESLCTPQSTIWHRLTPMDKTLKRNKRVRMWFDDVNELLFKYRYRPTANFVENSQQTYMSLGAYGNGPVYIDAPDNSRGLRYRHVHLGDIYFAENQAGVIDTAYRRLRLTPRQAVRQFGEAKLPDQIREAAKNAAMMDTSKFEFWHVVTPREDRDPGRPDVRGMAFASYHISVTGQMMIRESGYRTFPFPTARLSRAPGESYGRGPGQWVLPNLKTINEEKKTMLKQGHRALDPVLLAFDDGVIDSFSLKAGALNRGGVNKDGRPLVHTLPTGNLAIGEKLMDQEAGVIRDSFLVTLFQILVDTPRMTATEVLERAREKGLLVAPTAGAINAGWLGPMIERELDLLATQGLLPPPPPIVVESGGEYKVEYDSPISRMQRAEKAAGFKRALADAVEYANVTQDPSPLDWFNFDVAMPEILDIHGSPASWTRDEEEVAQRRAERDAQRQQQQMVEAAPAMASVVKAAPELAKLGGGAPR